MERKDLMVTVMVLPMGQESTGEAAKEEGGDEPAGEADPGGRVSTGEHRRQGESSKKEGLLAVLDESIKSSRRLKAEKMLLDCEEL